jgi:hypothetical protein
MNKLIEELNFRDIHLLKPIVDGKSIQVLYECKAGKHIKSIIDECLKY